MLDLDEVRERVINVCKTIYDPEIPVDIYELGLIYKIDLYYEESALHCHITMTLTSPGCPVADLLIEQVYNIRYIIEEIKVVDIDVVFDPPWSQDDISYEAKLELGLL